MGFNLVLYGFLINLASQFIENTYMASILEIAGLILAILGLCLLAKYNPHLRAARNAALWAIVVSIGQAVVLYYFIDTGQTNETLAYTVAVATIVVVTLNYLIRYQILRGIIDLFADTAQKRTAEHAQRCLYLQIANIILMVVAAPTLLNTNLASAVFVQLVEVVSVVYLMIVLWMAKTAYKRLEQQDKQDAE